MTESEKPTLTSRVGSGGIVAQDGFDFQIWQALLRVPEWLLNPAFEGLIIEGLEDFEARFFMPLSPLGRVLDRYQVKKDELQRGDLKKVFNAFLAFEKSYPRRARVHTLIVTGLPSSLKWIERDPNRVRRARPFYAPFSDICAASECRVLEDFRSEFGDDLGEFVAGCVDVCTQVINDRGAAVAQFSSALHAAFESLDCTQRVVQDVFERLESVMIKGRGRFVSRYMLIDVIESGLSTKIIDRDKLCMHVLSDDSELRNSVFVVDAACFSGKDTCSRTPEEWQDRLVSVLEAASSFFRQLKVQRIELSGLYRLSVAMVIGWAFRAVYGFEFDIRHRGRNWSVESCPIAGADQVVVPWRIDKPNQLVAGRLVVSVGVVRDPSSVVLKFCESDCASDVLRLYLDRQIVSDSEIQCSVDIIRRTIDDAVREMSPVGIDLFLLCPSVLAVALGHCWNAFPPTQLYEFDARIQSYVKSACL